MNAVIGFIWSLAACFQFAAGNVGLGVMNLVIGVMWFSIMRK